MLITADTLSSTLNKKLAGWGAYPDMQLEMTEEQALIVAMVRRFVREEIVPLELNLDPDTDTLDPDDEARLTGLVKEMGLYGMGIPPEYGGPDMDMVTRTLVAIEMSQHRAGLYAPCYGVFGGASLAQLFEANDDQKDRYLYPTLRGEKRGFFGLTEPSGGSDPARAIQTKAIQDGDDWVINGGKIFISGADRADYGLVFARTSEDKGRGGVTCFIVDTDTKGFHVRRIVHTLRSAHYATELQFDDMRVPAANILGEVNKGFAIANDRLSRQRIPYSAGCIGVAVKAHELALEYSKVRETFGAPLSSRQSIQWMLVDNEIDIQQARWATLEAASLADRGEPFRKQAAMAKLIASEGASRVVDRSMQIHGGYGVTKDFPFERWYREMRIRRIGEGPSEVQRHIIARDILGASLR
ncbi:MAG: acyl-CoA dehydrogenase family protein [Gammaproteobacteria bacterium]